MQDKIIYDLDGRPHTPINLAEQFKLFAATTTGKKREPIGTGQEDSPLAQHGANILHEKEKE